MSEILENMAEETMPQEIVTRKNDFCVVSKTPNENGWYDIQKNSAWSAVPYEGFVEVEDELVEGAFATGGYLIPTFNEDGTKMIDYKPTEIPVIETPEPEPTEEELQWQAITDLEIAQMETTAMIANLTEMEA